MIRNIRLDKMKIKTKNYVQNHSASILQIKSNSKSSFQQLIQNNQQFDDYIMNSYNRMRQDQSQNPNLIIPKKFEQFINSKLFKELLKKIYEYMLLIQEYQEKYKQITASNHLKDNKIMIYQSGILEQKCKEISYIYMGILLSYGQSKFIFKDQYFFQTMIYFLSVLLKENFDEAVYPIIDEELNRIFRTNTFNLIKRRYQQDRIIKKYPELKDAKYVPTKKGDQRLINRLRIHKRFRYAAQLNEESSPTLSKPINISQSASKSIYTRSPLIASYFPSSRQKLFTFNREQKERGSIVRSMGCTRSYSFQKG